MLQLGWSPCTRDGHTVLDGLTDWRSSNKVKIWRQVRPGLYKWPQLHLPRAPSLPVTLDYQVSLPPATTCVTQEKSERKTGADIGKWCGRQHARHPAYITQLV